MSNISIEEIKILQTLIDRPGVIGKKLLKDVIWMNTTEPKYKVGDCIKVTNLGRKVYGAEVRNFGARIEKISYSAPSRDIYYECSMIVVKDGEKPYETFADVYEKDVKYTANNNVNYITSNCEVKESFDLHI